MGVGVRKGQLNRHTRYCTDQPGACSADRHDLFNCEMVPSPSGGKCILMYQTSCIRECILMYLKCILNALKSPKKIEHLMLYACIMIFLRDPYPLITV